MAVKRGAQVTLSDIARRVKVSKVTVSKALRGHPDISSDTARRIKAVARELGYSPNFWARNLSSRRSNTIGVIVPKIAHFFFSAVIEAIYDAAFANNYEIILTVSAESAERERRHIESLLSMRVDGLMVSVSQETRSEAVFDSVASMGVPFTFIDRMVETERFNSVVADDRGGAYAATEQAISIGYRKLAILGGFQHTNIGRERYRGFATALKRYDIPVRPEWIIHGGFSEDDGYRGFKRLFEAGALPEFIFAVTYPVTLGVYRAADELGIRIPDDVDIICFGNSGVNRFLNPPVSYVEQPTRELGRRAFELTLENIQQRDDFSPQHIVLPTTLVLSKTCVKRVAGRKKG